MTVSVLALMMMRDTRNNRQWYFYRYECELWMDYICAFAPLTYIEIS